MNIRKRIGNRGFTLVELMIVIVIIGVLAALASFGFAQYVKKSKTAESDEFVKKLADGSRTYFTSEQKYGGDEEWWHAAGAGSQAAGFPVPYGSKVYPGGDGWTFKTHSGDPPVGGAKASPDALVTVLQGAASKDKAAIKKLQFNVTEPTYFRYSYSAAGQGNGATATVVAEADFDPATAGVYHTQTRNLSVQNGEVLSPPSVITNEFE